MVERIENGPFAVNTYIVGCPATKRAVLIDPGHDIRLIERRVKASGLDFTAIVNTHGHVDHVAGVDHFRRSMGLPFRMHRGDALLIERLPEVTAAFGLPPIPPPIVDEWLDAGVEIAVGDLRFVPRHAPGHSPGSLVFDLGDEMIVGDVIFLASIGRTDLPGGDHATLIDSIRRQILSRPDHVVLHAGHGPPTTVGQERATNPFLQGA
jgi:glyoxylase-like metal-dependent hydrolase (beta-lactamase superfamily II)